MSNDIDNEAETKLLPLNSAEIQLQVTAGEPLVYDETTECWQTFEEQQWSLEMFEPLSNQELNELSDWISEQTGNPIATD